MDPSSARALFGLEPGLAFLNHGAFGACPLHVQEVANRLRAHIEADPVRFFTHECYKRMDGARERLAAFVGVEPRDFVFVRNATEGVNSVLRSLRFEPGDEILCTNHGYNACCNVLEYVARRAHARVVVADVPFPIRRSADVVAAIEARVSDRTKFALIDHVTSPTGLVFPIEEIVRRLSARGVEVMVDGAHAPGMLALHVGAIGAAYYTGNFHKWMCAPRGAAFLAIRRDKQADIHPAVISHGYNRPRTGNRLHDEFDLTGTDDRCAWACVVEAIDLLESQYEGGWPAIRAHCRERLLGQRAKLCAALRIDEPAPADMIGMLAAVPLSDGPAPALYEELRRQHQIQVPVIAWPLAPKRLVRLSCHIYNECGDYERLLVALTHPRA